MSTQRTFEKSNLNSLSAGEVIVDPQLISTLKAKPCSVIKEQVRSFFTKVSGLKLFSKKKFDKDLPSQQLRVQS